ncbi:MAG TPA: glycosyltransferase family 4 protein [Candidatus Angelobacter sp.]
MRIALIAPPFITVPPKLYGGTELFIAKLAEGLDRLGLEVIVYTNGESTIGVEKRWLYPKEQWPLSGDIHDNLKDLNHTAWAVRDAAESCEVIHLNNAAGVACSRFVDCPFVFTVHHPHEPGLSEYYAFYPEVNFVTISHFQRTREKMPRIRTIHHGLDLSLYEYHPKPKQYLSFLGRIAPIKGTDLAIAIAKKAGIPLKIAGEVQPMFRKYFDSQIKPHLDGKFIEYIGEADLETKNELLGNSLALLFPIQWEEPFGLVMIEAMACGTPVLAFPGGSVAEVVRPGVSGFISPSVDELVQHARDIESEISRSVVRQYVEENFALEQMVRSYADLYEEIAGGKAVRSQTKDERAIA